MPVACCQELRFPKGHQRRVKKELEALNRNYICFTEVGLDRKYAESQREDHGWNSKLNFAVATFLHTGIFDAKKSSRKEWASTIQTHSMAHMARGRVQWIDAVTKQGKGSKPAVILFSFPISGRNYAALGNAPSVSDRTGPIVWPC